jgi:hypothetical protein
VGKDSARVVLEASALEGYRTELLPESAVRQMLRFETRMELHAFLKVHGVYLHYDVADLTQDQVTAQKLRGRLKTRGLPLSPAWDDRCRRHLPA